MASLVDADVHLLNDKVGLAGVVDLHTREEVRDRERSSYP
jgi:hypothetical protein